MSTGFSTGGSEKNCVDALARIASHSSTHSEGLVIGISHNSYESETLHHTSAG